jgi:preprotein translocase subunit SecF
MEEQMTKVIRFTKIRFFTIGLSVLLLLAGFVVILVNGGFNLGIDFQAGLNERVQIAPVGFSLSYSGDGDARLDSVSGGLYAEVRSGEGVKSYTFLYEDYPTLQSLASGFAQVPGLSISSRPTVP